MPGPNDNPGNDNDPDSDDDGNPGVPINVDNSELTNNYNTSNNNQKFNISPNITIENHEKKNDD